MDHTIKFTFLLQIFIVYLLGLRAAEAKEDQELLESVREAHRATRESIQTFSGRIEFTLTITQKSKSPVTHTCSSQYWHSPKAMRAKISENNEQMDYLWKESVRQSVIRGLFRGQPVASAGRHRYSQRHAMRCDPFVRGLLVFNLPNSGDYMPFEELVEHADKLKKLNGNEWAEKS